MTMSNFWHKLPFFGLLVFFLFLSQAVQADEDGILLDDKYVAGKVDTQTTVHDTWHLLQKLETSKSSIYRPSKPSGIPGHAYHYLKLAFRILFMNSSSKQTSIESDVLPKISKSLAVGVEILHKAASEDNRDAIFLLAEMNFYGNFTHPRNYKSALERYSQLASLDGNHTAQYMLGFMYATGIGGAVERDQAKALMYHTFAAEQGNTRSEMTIAFRHVTGIATPRNCDQAVHYYKKAADKVMAYWKAGPPGGTSIPKQSYRWADDAGGVYGEGASVSSSGFNANKDGSAHAAIDDIVEYLDALARDGDLKATFSLGKLYYEGSRGMRRNLKRAQRQFMKVAKVYWTREGKINPNAPKNIDKLAGKAAGHIGRMFLRGEGMETSYEKAITWFRRGLANGDSMCQYHLGLMYRDGLGVPKDAFKAASFFRTSADQGHAGAQSILGVMFLDQGDVETADRYFELAARQGAVEGFYYLAELKNRGVGQGRQCGTATAYYKIVAEKAEALHSTFTEANDAYDNGDLETALVASMMAAEQGYENAQANVAYLLDEQTSVLSLSSVADAVNNLNPLTASSSRPAAPTFHTDTPLALIYWTRSAKQANIDSLLKMGDYYLSGTGTTSDIPDPERANTCYETAANQHNSAQAFWNLGWMHENGISVPQDFHMAKRFYDLALETNSEAYLPVKLALVKLRARSYWNDLTRGSVNSIHDEPVNDKSKTGRSLSEWISNFLDNVDEQDRLDAAAAADDDELTGGAFSSDPMPGGDDSYDDLDDGLIESLIIVGLAATLAFLVYYRQQRQAPGRREMVVQQGVAVPVGVDGRLPDQPGDQAGGVPEGQERGFFPRPGDAEMNDWVAGGVGH